MRLAMIVLLGIAGAAFPAGSAGTLSPPPSLVRLSPETVPAGAYAVRLGPAQTVRGALVLKPRDGRSLTRFIASAAEPGSAEYGHYLNPRSFAQRFGPPEAIVDAAARQLRRAGLRVGVVSPSRLVVPFTGTAGRVNAAFDTEIARYRLPDGQTARGTLTPVRLTSRLTGSVAAVVGLNSVSVARPRTMSRSARRPERAADLARARSTAGPAGAPQPCPAARIDAFRYDGLTDDQIADAYGANSLYAEGDRGSGQRIAVYENDSFLKSDLATFDECYFGASQAAQMMKRLQLIPLSGGEPTGAGAGEATLDVEDISALAPAARIDVYEGPFAGSNPTDFDSLDEYAAIVDADRDKIVSVSYGLCEQSAQVGQSGLQQAENVLFQQAAAQGQTIFVASGDNGSDDCTANERAVPPQDHNPVAVDDPSTQPYAVSVGGSTILDASSRRPLQQVWNDGARYGAGGGGISESWEMPSWQRDATVPGIALPGGADWRAAQALETKYGYPSGFCQNTNPGATSSTPCRLVPDVSADADDAIGAVTIYSSDGHVGWTTVGGTSSATPIWAATLALIDASPTCRRNPADAHGLGFLSPQIYALASDPARYRASFTDITLGNNDIDGIGGGRLFSAHPGYDLATGLGSPRLTGDDGTAGLAYYLCAAQRQPAAPVVSALSPQSVSTSGGATVTVTGSGFGTAEDPLVSSVQVGTRRIDAGDFRVTSPTSLLVTVPAAGVAPDSPAPQDASGPALVIVTLRDDAGSAPGPQATLDYVDSNGGATTAVVDAVSPSGGLEENPGPVTIIGVNLSGVSSVTFGGVAATSFRVHADSILVTPPPLSSATACAPLPAAAPFTGENAGNDVCQVAVRVIDSAGASPAAPILPPLEGPFKTNSVGDVEVPSGCDCEDVSAPDEYDYLPKPTITSVSTSLGPSDLASERGGTVITIHGSGLDPLALDWADFGDPNAGSSIDTQYVFVSGTEMQVSAPQRRLTANPVSVNLSVRTLVGQSAPVVAQFAGVPRISGVVNLNNGRRLSGIAGAPDTGGTPLRVLGAGLGDQVIGPLRFRALDPPAGSSGTQFSYSRQGTGLTTRTVSQFPGLVSVRACTASGCSASTRAAQLAIYPPGTPRLTGIAPSAGPAAGGTQTAVLGANIRCPLMISFGGHLAGRASIGEAMQDCSANTELAVKSPKGVAGTTVRVKLATAESYFTGHDPSFVRFRYTR
jgi:hypothetical protein